MVVVASTAMPLWMLISLQTCGPSMRA